MRKVAKFFKLNIRVLPFTRAFRKPRSREGTEVAFVGRDVQVRVVILLLVVLLTTGARCGPTAQNIVKSGDDLARLGKAASLADDLSRVAAAGARSSAKVDNGLTAGANSIRVVGSSDEVTRVRDALKAIAWQAFCDVLEGELRAEAESVANWFSNNAGSFGLSFTGDADLSLAGTVIEQLRAYPTNTRPPTACERLPNSGL